jgi:hypothetical protein
MSAACILCGRDDRPLVAGTCGCQEQAPHELLHVMLQPLDVVIQGMLHTKLQQAARAMVGAWSCGMGARAAELLHVSRPTAGRILDGASPVTLEHLCAAAAVRAGAGASMGELWNALDEVLDVVRMWDHGADTCPTCAGQGTQLGASARSEHAASHSRINEEGVYCHNCSGLGRVRRCTAGRGDGGNQAVRSSADEGEE